MVVMHDSPPSSKPAEDGKFERVRNKREVVRFVVSEFKLLFPPWKVAHLIRHYLVKIYSGSLEKLWVLPSIQKKKKRKKAEREGGRKKGHQKP